MKLTKFYSLFICLFFVGYTTVYGQVTVTGKVTSTDGEPMIGVTILEKDTGNGTATDFDGNYTLTVPETATLVFSYTGMSDIELPASGATSYDVVMEEESALLDQVVVVGYGTKRKKDVTGSISSVNSERLERRNLKSVPEAIQGEVAGVQITTPARPGDASVIRIRGYNTLNNNRPLILVDGVEVSRLFTVDPNDIESISVLKDAASAAIYGNRASNGVVLITTKKGLRDRQTLTYNAFVGWQEATNTVDMLNAEQYVNLINEARDNAGLSPLYNASEVREWEGQSGTDWQDEVLQRGLIQNHHLNFTGGTKTSNYSLSAGYMDQEGIYIETDFQRYNLKVSADHTFKGKLKIGQSINLNYSEQNTGGDFYISRTFMMPPTVPVFLDNGEWGFDPKGATNGILKNPVAMSTLIRWEVTHNHTFGNVFADYEFFEGLNFRTNLKFDRRIEEKDYFEPEYQLGEFGRPGGAFQQAFADVADFKEYTYEWDNVLTFKRLLANKHNVGLVLGTSARKHFSEFFLAKGFDIPEGLSILDLVATQNRIIIGSNTGYRFFSMFGRADYSFSDKYFLSATLRRDGSSRFIRGQRFGNFPAIGLGWRVSEEAFFPKNNLITEMKFRGSWGKLGNSAIGDFEYQSLVNFNLNYAFGGAVTQGAAPIDLANENIRWETTEQIDIGLDLELFNGVVDLKADYYIKDTRDILFPVPIPAVTGAANSPRQNIGHIRNKGLELELKVNYSKNDFWLSTGGNIAFLNNELIDFEGISFTTGREGSSHIFREGDSFRALWGYETMGVFQNEEQLNSLPHFPEAAPGDLIFKDVNGDGEITPADRTILGQSIPKFTYGFNLDLGWKGFDVSAMIQGVEGSSIILANANFGGGRGFFDFFENNVAERMNRWHGEGTSNTQPRLVFQNDPGKNQSNSDFFLQDGSYLRLKNLQVGYTIPSDWTQKIGIQKFRIYGGGTNLLTLTEFTGFDPEIAAEASDSFGWNYPMAKTVIFGVNVVF